MSTFVLREETVGEVLSGTKLEVLEELKSRLISGSVKEKALEIYQSGISSTDDTLVRRKSNG